MICFEIDPEWHRILLTRSEDEIQAIVILGCGACVKLGSCDHKDADTEHVVKAAACSDFELPALVNDGGERTESEICPVCRRVLLECPACGADVCVECGIVEKGTKKLINDGGERISHAVNEVAFNLRSNPLVSEVHIRTPQQGAVKSLLI